MAAVAAPVLPGVPEKVRKLAEKRANRRAQEGAEEDWREKPDTPYRQRLYGCKGSLKRNERRCGQIKVHDCGPAAAAGRVVFAFLVDRLVLLQSQQATIRV